MKTDGWEDRLDQFFRDRALVKFEWGVQDCCMFCYDAIKIMTEKDMPPSFDWKYSTRIGAFKLLKNKYNLGFLNSFIRVFRDLGFEEVDEVKYGDVLFARTIIDDPEEKIRFGGATMAVGYNDLGAIVVPGEEGLMLIEDYELIRAWRI